MPAKADHKIVASGTNFHRRQDRPQKQSLEMLCKKLHTETPVCDIDTKKKPETNLHTARRWSHSTLITTAARVLGHTLHRTVCPYLCKHPEQSVVQAQWCTVLWQRLQQRGVHLGCTPIVMVGHQCLTWEARASQGQGTSPATLLPNISQAHVTRQQTSVWYSNPC